MATMFLIDTNLVLSFALTIISNFSQIVPLPPGSRFATTDDIAVYRVGMFSEPLTLILADRAGTTFRIRGGAVWHYDTGRGVFGLQNPNRIREFLGPAKLNPNAAVILASNVVRRLVKSGDPLADIRPMLRRAGVCDGQEIPFYEVFWPHSDWDEVANVQVDARDGSIASLDLHNDSFHDIEFLAQMSNRTCKVLINENAPRPIRRLPQPATRDLLSAIDAWLRTCRHLGIDSGPSTGEADIDWTETWTETYTNRPFERQLHVAFTNGTSFRIAGGVVLEHVSWDALFYRGGERWRGQRKRFEGQIRYDWHGLAETLKTNLCAHLHISSDIFANYRIEESMPAAVGQKGLIRIELLFFDKRYFPDRPTVNGLPAMSAEFDLSTGSIKRLAFMAPDLIAAIQNSKDRM